MGGCEHVAGELPGDGLTAGVRQGAHIGHSITIIIGLGVKG